MAVRICNTSLRDFLFIEQLHFISQLSYHVNEQLFGMVLEISIVSCINGFHRSEALCHIKHLKLILNN